jgi:hypothetical protein
MTGDAKLSNQEDIQRSRERTRNFEGDRHAPARQAEDEQIVTTVVVTKILGQPPSSIGPIEKPALKDQRVFPR